MTELFNHVIQELNNGVFNNTYIKRVFDTKYDIIKNGLNQKCELKPNKKGRCKVLREINIGYKSCYYCCTCFGNVYLDYYTLKIVDSCKEELQIFTKNGVEVLGMIPARDKNGKYCYDGGKSIKELRECCKMNGVKGYSNKDKAGIIQLLMKV